MKMGFNLAKALGIGAVFALVSGGAAFAAIVTGPADLYSGPGSHYRVLGSLTDGENVNIVRTSGSWCLLGAPGPSGWAPCADVSSNVGNALTADVFGTNELFGPNFGLTASPRDPPPYPSPEFTGPQPFRFPAPHHDHDHDHGHGHDHDFPHHPF